jgi:methionyl-tRNA formyltransferase
MNKIALYIMNSKGYYVLKKFIEKFGADSVAYVVSSEDTNIQKDYFDEIVHLATASNIVFIHRSEACDRLEKEFSGYKFAVGWRWMIADDRNLIVFHDSLLPKYRGFAPLVNGLINQEKHIGVTALFANGEYDSGNIIAQRSVEISYPIKINQAIQKIEPIYFQLVDEIFSTILMGKPLVGRAQETSDASYSLWLDSEDYFVDWAWSAEKIKRFVDAVGHPYDHAKCYLNNRIIKLKDVELHDDVHVEHRERHIGKVIFMRNGVPTIVCSEGLLSLTEICDRDNNACAINFRSRFI